MKHRIIVNGKEYASVDDMTPDIRRIYESTQNLLDDNDGDGVPDRFKQAMIQTESVRTTTRYTINGQVYDDISAVPPELRAQLDEALRALDSDGNKQTGGSRLAGASTIPPPVARVESPTSGGQVRTESTDIRLVVGAVVLIILLLLLAIAYFRPQLGY